VNFSGEAEEKKAQLELERRPTTDDTPSQYTRSYEFHLDSVSDDKKNLNFQAAAELIRNCPIRSYELCCSII